MNTKEIREYKKHLKLTKRQREILVGLLLGDGHLETLNDGRTYRLKIEHSIAQKDYVMWLYEEFKDWVRSRPRKRMRKDGGEQIGFTTYSHESFRFYAQQFYTDHKKIIPKMIHKLLAPIGIAVWFMDDGSRKSNKHKTYIIHTLGFKKKELEIIQEALEEKFNIKTSLHKQKGKYWRLYVLSESVRAFEGIIKPYISQFSSMKYKLGNTNA